MQTRHSSDTLTVKITANGVGTLRESSRTRNCT